MVTGGGAVSPFRRMGVAERFAAPGGGDIVPDSRSSSAEYSAKGADMSPPVAWRRAFSCFACTDRKCAASSCHLMSSRAIFERVAATLGIGLVMISVWRNAQTKYDSRLRCYMQKACRIHRV
jgi:hypothetical protein